MDITDLLLFTQQNKASDLHLSSGSPPLFRVNGDIAVHSMPLLEADDVKQMIYSLMTEQQRADYERHLELDFAIAFGDSMRFRVNAFNTIHGPAAVMRTIPTKVLPLSQLNVPPAIQRLADLHKGLILVTGPTGSGKSTTLAAIVDHINTNYPKHILTVEDPVEFVHSSKKSLINQREVGRSTHSFASALKSALREDPDVILVGELRDLETMQLALSAAETGHLVLATLHTNSAPESVDRFIDVFPHEAKEMVRAMLSNTLQGVVTQLLLKRRDGGRVAAFEIMLGTPAVRNLVREGRIPQLHSMMQMGARHGMLTMKDHVADLLEKRIITEDIAQQALVSVIKNEMAELPVAPRAKAVPEAKSAPSISSARKSPQGDVF